MNSNSTFNFKKCMFLFIVSFALTFFGFRNFASAKTITINDTNNLSSISIENKDLLQFDEKITSVDLSKLPTVEGAETKQIVIELKGNSKIENNLPDKYEIGLIISPISNNNYTSFPKTNGVYYVGKGSEEDPNILMLNSPEFDLSLLPSVADKTYLMMSDSSDTKGIEFSGSLPENYVVSEIYILNEADEKTFKDAFPNTKIVKYNENNTSSTAETSKDLETSTLDTSSNSSTGTTDKSSTSNKSTGEDISTFYVLGICFVTFTTLSLMILIKKHKFD